MTDPFDPFDPDHQPLCAGDPFALPLPPPPPRRAPRAAIIRRRSASPASSPASSPSRGTRLVEAETETASHVAGWQWPAGLLVDG